MGETVPVDYGAEAFVELLNANNVDYIFINPGTDTFPIQEAVSKFRALGKRTPEVVLCLHESVGMAAAHGYFMISGQPQVVLVHVGLGIQQVGGALHNAQRGQIGVMLCAGRSPLPLDPDDKSGRPMYINWLQEQFNEAEVVRGYVKWEYELRSNKSIHQVIQRAFQVASTEPCGPVYLSLPLGLLKEKIESVRIPAVARHGAASTPQADYTTLNRVADMLINAENPVIITGNSGRHPESVASLVALAEILGAPVITSRLRMNFPTTHPLCAGVDPLVSAGHPNPHLVEDADTILVIDRDIPYVPTQVNPRPDATIIHIDIDPLKRAIPTWFFPADMLIEADSSKAIPALSEIIRRKATPEHQARWQARFSRIESDHLKLCSHQLHLAMSKAGQNPISAEWLCHCIAEVIDENTIILDEAVTNSPAVARQIPRTKPGTMFSSGGSSLGWGLGAALGAKMAAPSKTVVALVGDGSYVFGCPTASLWAADVYGAPFLTIIFNNQEYNAVKKALRSEYGKESYSESTGFWPGMDISPSPNYALIAQACHANGLKIEDPSELPSALKSALDQVRSGRSTVLDVIVERDV